MRWLKDNFWLFPVALTGLLVRAYGIADPWMRGHRGFMGALSDLVARNYGRYGLQARLAPLWASGPLSPAEIADHFHVRHPSLRYLLTYLFVSVLGLQEWTVTLMPVLFSVGSIVTVYFLVLPSGRMVDALQIESDRMVNCLLDSTEVVSERNVVHEERRMGMDRPDGALWEALNQAAYTVHPYRNSVVGFDETILSFDHENAREYYEEYYTPSNAVLTVVGDFDTDELLEDINEYFGDLPSRPLPGEPSEIEPAQTSRRYVEVEHESNLARLLLAFHVPEGSHPDSPVLDLISTYLSSGRAGRLDEVLVETGVASSAYAYHSAGIDPGLFVFGVTLMPGVDPAEAEEIIWEELESLSADELPADVLADLQAMARASDILGEVTPLGKAFDKMFGAAQGNECTFIEDGHTVTELLRFFHVMGRVDHGHPVGFEALDALEDVVARLWIHTYHRFVEKKKLRLVEQPDGEI